MDAKEKEVNPFRPPTASLEVEPEVEKGLFFTASPLKFAIMSLVTFAFYCLYWFYKNFKVMRDSGHPGIMPFWRAFFSVLWAYSCFNEIVMRGGPTNALGRSPVALAILYLVLSVSSRLPDPWWLISLVAFVPVMIANGWAREVNEQMQPGYPENSRLSGWNWVGIVVGGLLLVLITIGLFLPPGPA